MRFLLGLSLLTLVCWGQPPIADPPRLGGVIIAVSTSFGDPLPKPLIVLRAIGPTSEYKKSGDNTGVVRFDGIPFGMYDLEVSDAGFNTRRERIGIYQPEVKLAVGLVLAPLDDPPPAEIKGSITLQNGNPADLWVRLVPRYGGDFLEDHVTPAGTFHLGNVYPGRFVLLVFDKEDLVLTKTLVYRGGKLTLNLDIPDRN